MTTSHKCKQKKYKRRITDFDVPLQGLKNTPLEWIESDFVDTEAIASSLQIKTDGLLGISLDASVQDVIKATGENASDPAGFVTSNISFEKEGENITFSCDIEYEDGPMATSEWDGNQYNYMWNDIKPAVITTTVPLFGKLEDKREQLIKSIDKLLKSIGWKEYGTGVDGEINYTCGENMAFLANEPNNIRLTIGRSSSDIIKNQYCSYVPNFE